MSYDPNAKHPDDFLEACSECGGDGFVWTRPGGIGTPFTEITCRSCGGSGMAHKDDNARRRQSREPDHDPREDRLPDPSREP